MTKARKKSGVVSFFKKTKTRKEAKQKKTVKIGEKTNSPWNEANFMLGGVLAVMIIFLLVVSAAPIGQWLSSPPKSCEKNDLNCCDSDGGKNLFEKGYVYSDGRKLYTDICAGPYDYNSEKLSLVREGYCDKNGKPQTTTFSCEKGCSNGKCIE